MSLRRVRRLLESGMFGVRQAARGLRLGANMDWNADRENYFLIEDQFSVCFLLWIGLLRVSE